MPSSSSSPAALSPLIDLPFELLHAVLHLLPPADIEHFAQTCKLARSLVYGPDGSGDVHLWNHIYHRDWDPQPSSASACEKQPIVPPLRIVREREAAKRSIQLAGDDESVIVRDYNQTLQTLLSAAVNRTNAGRNAAWLESLTKDDPPNPWTEWVYPRNRAEHYASWKQAAAMYPDVYGDYDRLASGQSKRRKVNTGDGQAESMAQNATMSVSPPEADPVPKPASAEQAKPARRRSMRLLKRALPDHLQMLVDEGREVFSQSAPDTDLAAQLNCLHGPRAISRYTSLNRATARRRVYDSGWTGWENGYGPFHFFRQREEPAAEDDVDFADGMDDESDASGRTTDTDDINPDPVPIFMSDDELEQLDVERQEEARRPIRLRLAESEEEDDQASAGEDESSEGSVPGSDVEIVVEDSDEGDGGVDGGEDSSDDDDFDLDGFMDPMGLRQLLREGLVRNHAGRYRKEQLAAHLRAHGRSEVPKGAANAQAGDQQPTQQLRSKRVDWKMLEAIMIVMHNNVEEAKGLNWGRELRLPRRIEKGGMLVDPKEDGSYLQMPTGWSIGMDECCTSVDGAPSRGYKSYDWARVEGCWAGTYAFLDYSVFIASNAGFAQHRAKLTQWAATRDAESSNVAPNDGKSRGKGGRADGKGKGKGKGRTDPPLPCLAGVSDSNHRCELCLVLPTLQSTEEAFGDLLELRLELLPLADQPALNGSETGAAQPAGEDVVHPDFPPLLFRGHTIVSGTDVVRGNLHGMVRPIFAPLSDEGKEEQGAEVNGSPMTGRRIEGLHWSFMHAYEGEDRWQSEAVQPGPPGGATPMYAIWTDATHERNSPNGPACYWRMDPRPWREVKDLVDEEDRRRRAAWNASR